MRGNKVDINAFPIMDQWKLEQIKKESESSLVKQREYELLKIQKLNWNW